MKLDDKHIAIFSIDVDGWPSTLKYYLKDVDEDEIFRRIPLKSGVSKLINLLKSHQIKGTFFVPGEIAEKFPSVVREISGMGHEVACHGMNHGRDEFLESYESQEKSIRKATEVLEGLTGKKVNGFRAPAFQYNDNTTRALLANGYLYDSSSIKTWGLGLYGDLFSSRYAHESKVRNEKGEGLGVLPVGTTPLVPVPLGGAWLRAISHPFIGVTLKYYKKLNTPLVLYTHPKEVSRLPKIKGIPWYQYHNTGDNCLNILERFIVSCKKEKFNFLTMGDYFQIWNERKKR